MMAIALGSPFEMTLRILILLEAAYEGGLTEGKISALDYMTVYARDFNLADVNLHGDNTYRFGEFAARRELVNIGVKRLVLDGLVSVSQTEEGFLYMLNDIGLNFASNLDTEYADSYFEIATNVIDTMSALSEEELTGKINMLGVSSVQRR